MTIFSFSLFARAPSPWDNQPVREELFSADRIEEHARSLAIAQKVTAKPTKGHPLAGRLAENGAVLLAAYKSLLQGADEGRAVTPAAEWLIDNFHLVEKQIREIRSDLPPGLLPAIAKTRRRTVCGLSARLRHGLGLCRAYRQPLRLRNAGFAIVRAYQQVQPLTIGELWAVSITLQIVMIENLRRLAEQIVNSRVARHEADDLADRLLGAAGQNPEPA